MMAGRSGGAVTDLLVQPFLWIDLFLDLAEEGGERQQILAGGVQMLVRGWIPGLQRADHPGVLG